jgi:hypothetical protein
MRPVVLSLADAPRIRDVLSRCDRFKEAAQLLNVSERTLRNKRHALGMPFDARGGGQRKGTS